jgi:hypothetical protein
MIRKIIIIAVVLIGFAFLGVFLIDKYLFPFGHELDVTFYNNTDIEITEFYLTYRGLEEDILLNDIGSGESINIRIDAVDNIDESDLVLYYYDNNGVKQEIVVIGYFEGSGGGQKSVVSINSVDENGVFDIEVEGIRP